MAGDLPVIPREAFAARLAAAIDCVLPPEAVERLWTHYEQLRRWNRRLSLVGPGTFDVVVERHYAESLAGLAMLRPTDRVVVDVGAGAGFPGWVLAAARPDLAVTLVESRVRKWSFLTRVSQAAALPCDCLNARVSAALPEGFPSAVDLVLMRAVKLGEHELSALVSRLSRSGRLLVWSGERSEMRFEGLEAARSVPLGGSRSRRIAEWVPSGRERGDD